MKITKLMVMLLILGWGGSNSLLRSQDATPEQQLKQLQQQMQDLLQERKEDRQQIEQLKQRLDQTEKKLGDTQKTATETQKKAEDAQKTATEAVAKIQPIAPVPSEEAAAMRNFVVTGFADALYRKVEGDHGSFFLGHFNLLPLFRVSDKLLAEAEMEFELADNGEVDLGLEYAQIDYLFNDYVTFIFGRMLSPIGVLREKLDAGWINKLPTKPLTENGGTELIPENDIGVQARGAFHIWDPLLLTYSVCLVNGPGDDGAGNVVFDQGADFNKNPSGGGRLALFYPWQAHRDIEVGFSGQTGPWSNDGNELWSAAAVDATVHLNEYTEFRGEYIKTWQDMAGGPTLDRDGWWAQAAYKLAGLNLDLPMINNVEAVFRYSGLQLPTGYANQYMLGLNYHVTNTFVVKAAYAFGQSNTVDSDGNSLDRNQVVLQVAYGF